MVLREPSPPKISVPVPYTPQPCRNQHRRVLAQKCSASYGALLKHTRQNQLGDFFPAMRPSPARGNPKYMMIQDSAHQQTNDLDEEFPEWFSAIVWWPISFLGLCLRLVRVSTLCTPFICTLSALRFQRHLKKYLLTARFLLSFRQRDCRLSYGLWRSNGSGTDGLEHRLGGSQSWRSCSLSRR